MLVIANFAAFVISRAIVIPQMPNDIVSGITVAAYIIIYTILMYI